MVIYLQYRKHFFVEFKMFKRYAEYLKILSTTLHGDYFDVYFAKYLAAALSLISEN